MEFVHIRSWTGFGLICTQASDNMDRGHRFRFRVHSYIYYLSTLHLIQYRSNIIHSVSLKKTGKTPF
jgi:hypothetical protein